MLRLLIRSGESLRARALRKTRTWDDGKWKIMESIQKSTRQVISSPLGYNWHKETAAERIDNVAIFLELKQLLLDNPKAGIMIKPMVGIESDEGYQAVINYNMRDIEITRDALRKTLREGNTLSGDLSYPLRSEFEEGVKGYREYAIACAVVDARPIIGK